MSEIFGIALAAFVVVTIGAVIWVRRELRRDREANAAAREAFDQPDSPGESARPVWRPGDK